MEFKNFEKQYLAQYSERTLLVWNDYESKEPWAFRNHTEQTTKIFNKLPSICALPLNERELNIIQKLMITMAYLPFTECITAFAYFSTLNSEWCNVLYEHAYKTYVHASELNISELDLASQIYLASASILIKRLDVIRATASTQIMAGMKL